MLHLRLLPAALAASLVLAGCAEPSRGPSAQPGGTMSVRFTDVPSEAPANTTAVVCWRVEGNGTIPHTAVHHGPESHAGAGARFSDYPGIAYPGNASSADPAGYALPGTFCAGVPVSQDTYLRPHAMDSAGPPGVLGDERVIRARSPLLPPAPPMPGAASILAVNWEGANATAGPAGGNATLCWRVAGTGTIPHTAIHTDNVSHPGPAVNFTMYRGPAYYPDNATQANASGYALSPAGSVFCTAIPLPANGTLHLRAHALIPGQPGQDRVSPDERTLAAHATRARA